MAFDFFIPDWPLRDTVWAAYTGRAGGASQAPYDSFNVGVHVGDDAAVVEANRAALLYRLQRDWEPMELAWVNQVHGTHAQVIYSLPDPKTQADAVVTAEAGDCLWRDGGRLFAFIDCQQ